MKVPKGPDLSDNASTSSSSSSSSPGRIGQKKPKKSKTAAAGAAAANNSGGGSARSRSRSRSPVLHELQPVRRSRTPSVASSSSSGSGRSQNSEPRRRSPPPRRSRSASPAESEATNSSGRSGASSRSRGRRASGSDDDGGSDDDNNNNNNNINNRRARRLAEGGLNTGEKATPGRLRNPSKYTDRSMHTNLDRSAAVGNARRRMADGMPTTLTGICTNRLGRVRKCDMLVTPMNFRRLYLRLDNKFPGNLLLALTLDVSDNRLRTLEAADVINYYHYASMYLESTIRSPNDEILNSDLAVRWLMNAIDVLGKIDMCVGDVQVSNAIGEKYERAFGMSPDRVGVFVRNTVEGNRGDVNLRTALASLKRLADMIKPTDIRIWGIDDDDLSLNDDVKRYTPNVFLGEARKNEVRVYPLAEKKEYFARYTRE